MQTYPEIKRFVQETLGCTCPEDALNNIELQEESDDLSGRKVVVGDRLLIYIISPGRESSVQELIISALEQGVVERNKQGFNRFRLVIVSSRPDELRSLAEHAFGSSGYTDEKTHLHIVSESDVVGF